MAEPRKNATTPPATPATAPATAAAAAPGIFRPTTRPEPPAAADDADDAPGQGADDAPAGRGGRGPRRRKAAPAADRPGASGLKLHLSEDVRFRLRMLAFKRGARVSAVANEVLDKALPRWSLERTE